MKKHLLRSVVVALTIIFASCSVDDDEMPDTNGFIVDGVFHPTHVVYVNGQDTEENPDGSLADAVTITLATDAFINNPLVIDPLDYVVLKLKMTNVVEQDNIALFNYFIGVDGYNNNGVPQDAETLLWQYSSNMNLTAVEKNVTIHSVTASEIDLTYTFKRLDGKLIVGEYVGPYIPLQP